MCTDGRRCEHCPAVRIVAAPEVLGGALAALGSVVAVTANTAALLSHTGEYLPPALPGEALRCEEERVALRLHPDRLGEALLTPRALTLADESSTHRAYLTPLSDHLAARALELAAAEPSPPPDTVDWSTRAWHDTDQLDHLDALTADRYRVLPFTGARRVEPLVVPHLLTHLVDTGLPFTVAVPGGGCVQLHRGRGALVEQADGHVAVVFATARYAVGPAAVAECWLTSAHGPAGRTSAVELYDHAGRCVTVLTQTGPLCDHLHRTWEALAASLPDAC